jgi:DNA primase small subunit
VNKIETKAFIQEKFAEYYQLNSSSIDPPSSLVNREFAFLLFKERMMLRHKGVKNVEDLRTQLKTVVPSDVYYSSAHYEKPEEEMEAKGWLGADLVFDIDADHIPTPCGKQHDTWLCNNCGATGRGARPEMCPSCKGLKFDDKNWLCEMCLESAKRETMKLIEVLTRDFGLSLQEMTVAFSGHRGYHVHVEDEVVQTLDQMARKEIVDYMVGIGFEPRFHGLEEGLGPSLEEAGWRGRIAKGTYEFLLNATAEQLEEMGLKKNVVNSLGNQRDKILESWKSRGPWKMKIVSSESWKKIVQKAIENQSVKIDTVVTTDIHRLIRLTNTLHGKTGLKKMHVSVSRIEGFDPLKEAVAFKEGRISLLVFEAPEFRLGDERYGPYKNTKAELPTSAALFLLCKGAAQVKEEN